MTDIVYGYGFYIDLSEEQIRSFFEKHKEGLDKKIRDYLDSHPDELFRIKRDVFNSEEDENYEEELYGYIATIIRNETGINFHYRSANSGIGAIMLAEGFPWSFSGPETCLSREKFCEICKTYMEDLGIEGDPGYFRFKYFD